tara:strand:- start:337 stop:2088 length:1752 start_codon:yes stop_codon:yes gene_type:complete
MKQIVKTFINSIKKTIFKVWNKTNNNFKLDNLNIVKKFTKSVERALIKVESIKNINLKFDNLNIVKKFSKSVEKVIIKVRSKTNNNFKLDNLNIVKNFNKSVEKTIIKVQKKKNNKLTISKFNKYLIAFISLLFFYLFYLSIPILYDKNWLQKNIEKQLLENFKIEFSLSSDISYRILPSPHYLIKNSKILKIDDKTISLAEIKTLKVFVSQKNFFDKEKVQLKYIKINNADFTLLDSDFRFLKNSTQNKFSNKKIEVNKSKIFFKNNSDEIISIIKISQAFLFQDEEKFLNLIKLKGVVFNTPFSFDYNRKFESFGSEEINIVAKSLRFNFFNELIFGKKDNSTGKNIISILNSKINTNYKIENDLIKFNSINSKLKNSKISYEGELLISPFDLKINIDFDNYDLRKFINSDSILKDLIKTELLFNENISVSASITSNSDLKNKIYNDGKIYLNLVDEKLNINKSRFINKKIGAFELDNSNLSYENERLILSTDIIVNIKNSNKLFSLLQTNKKFRKPIKNILINLDYDFLFNEINFNNIKIDNQEINDELLRIIDGFSDNEQNNWNKSKRILNSFFEIYEG